MRESFSRDVLSEETGVDGVKDGGHCGGYEEGGGVES